MCPRVSPGVLYSAAVRGLCLVFAATLAACSGATERFTTWPGETDDIILLLAAVPGEPARFLSVNSGRPLARQTLESKESLLAIVVPRSAIEAIQPGIDLSPSGLMQAMLRSPPSECAVEVTSGGDAVVFPIPAESVVFELSSDATEFVESNLSLDVLIGDSNLSLPLGDPPCGPKSAPRPFEILGPVLDAEDRAEEFQEVERLDDLVVGITKRAINVYQRGQGAQRLKDEGLLSETQHEAVEFHRPPGGPFTMVVGHRTNEADNSLETGGLSWWHWTGSTFEHLYSVELDKRLESLAVSSEGRIAVVGADSSLYLGTVTSTIVQTLRLSGVVQLSHVAFSPSGDLVVSSEGSVERVDISARTVFDGVELVDFAGVAANSPVRNIAFMGDEIFAATHSRGVFRLRLGGPEAVLRTEVPIARPNTLCSEVMTCRGRDYSASNESLALAQGSAPKLVLGSSDCPVLTIFDPATGCAVDLATDLRRPVVHASEQFVTIAEVTGISEFLVSDLAEL